MAANKSDSRLACSQSDWKGRNIGSPTVRPFTVNCKLRSTTTSNDCDDDELSPVTATLKGVYRTRTDLMQLTFDPATHLSTEYDTIRLPRICGSTAPPVSIGES
jgi:hypothetical protein